MKKRTRYTAEFKTEVVIRLLREEDTLSAIASEYGISPVMLSRWKKEFLERAPEVFARGATEAEKELEKEREHIERLERKVGQLSYELDWVKKKKQKSQSDGEEIGYDTIERGNAKISVSRQCELLGLNRTSVYRPPNEPSLVSDEELHIRSLIDRIHTDEPTWGYRSVTSWLRNWKGILINKKRTRRIMRDMGIYAIYPKPSTSKAYLLQYKRPYLLRHMPILHANQVWAWTSPIFPCPKDSCICL